MASKGSLEDSQLQISPTSKCRGIKNLKNVADVTRTRTPTEPMMRDEDGQLRPVMEGDHEYVVEKILDKRVCNESIRGCEKPAHSFR